MPATLAHLFPLSVAELLDHPDFRAWAQAGDCAAVAWPEADPGVKKKFLAARGILRGMREYPAAVPTEAEKAADFATLLTQLNRSDTPRQPRRRWPRRLLAVAAGIALLIAAGIFFLRPTPLLEYATGNGERLEVRLADGTSVLLNANSSLQLLGDDWKGGDRAVELSGEAFFDVKTQERQGRKRPFIVRTTGADIEVLGTRFNVKNRRGADRVYLEEGAVRVDWHGAAATATELLPGEMVSRATVDDQPVHQAVEEPEEQISWRGGHLSFSHRPLREALQDISDIYGIKLHCATTELANQELSSAGIPTDNLPLALRLLETALDLRIEEEENSSTYLVTAAQ